MIKFLLVVALSTTCVVRAQFHGSFLGSNNKPLCVKEGNYVIIGLMCE